MQSLKRVTWPVVVLTLLGISTSLFAQRPLCNQFPVAEHNRARAAGLCRDPAPIIDVEPGPRSPDASLPPTVPSTASSLAVPNVVGQSFDDARSRLTRFTLQRSYRAAAEAGGTVLAQSPMAPATLPAGAAVSLVLSDGSLVRVPRVTNININEARQRLQKDLDLKAQPVVVTSDLRVGTVIEQQPAEGTLVKRGSAVRLQVSAGQEGPEIIDVPNVVGMPFDRAKSRLARFAVERIERPRGERGNSAPEGQVIEQTPRAAMRAATGSVIQLAVSSAPRATIELFEMPNVVGLTYADAARSLAEFKISRTEIESAAPRDRIVAQTPTATSTLMPGATVTLQVSTGGATASAAAAKATTNTSSAPSAVNPSKAASGRGVLAGVLGISAAVVLGLIAGGLLMRQWLLRQRAVAAADHAITSLSSAPPAVTTVDILLEEEAAAERAPGNHAEPEEPQEKSAPPAVTAVDILLEEEAAAARAPDNQVEPEELQEKESRNENELDKNPGP